MLEEPKNQFAHRIHYSAILYSETRFAKQPYSYLKTHFTRIRVSTTIPVEYRTIEQGIWMLEEPKNQFAHPNSRFRHSVFRYTVCKAAVFILKNPLYSDQSKHDNSSRIQNNRTRNLDVRRTKKPIRTSEFTIPPFCIQKHGLQSSRIMLKNPLYSDQSKHANSTRIRNNRTRNLDVRRNF